MAGTMRNSRPERRVGTLLAGRYRLDRLVANGGMAQVWEATDETLRRRVAVKILHDHIADGPTVARFRAEGVTAARLTHPGVVAIFDTCSQDGLDAIVMEYVDGPTLRDVLDREGPLEPTRAVAIALEIADALGDAHRLGLVHRDVKPANVLVCPDGTMKVTDFGIAKVRDESGADLTLPGTFIGTAKYLAPEQVEGASVDARADVYALGVVLYEMLAGTVPFDGATDAAIALARVQREPRPLREVAPHVSPELAPVVARAMSRDPGDRYPGMVELRAALASADPRRRPVAHAAAAQDATALQSMPPPQPRFAESERRWLVPAVFVSVVAISLALAAVLIGNSDAGHQIVRKAKEAVGVEQTDTQAPSTTPTAGALAIVAAGSFDPQGDQTEHNGEVQYLTDGDTATTWGTERYNDRGFGIKSGVGVYVELPSVADVRHVAVASPTSNWSASIHVATDKPDSLDGWGPALATRQNIAAGNTTFDVKGARGRYVLVWITDLGDARPARAELAEISVTSA